MWLKNNAMALLFTIIFISKLVSNVCKTLLVLLDTQNLLWEWLLTQNIWILVKLNCVCFRIRMMFGLWYQESSMLNFYIKCKQRVEKSFKTYIAINKTHFDFINHSFACNNFYFLELCKENNSKSLGGFHLYLFSFNLPFVYISI